MSTVFVHPPTLIIRGWLTQDDLNHPQKIINQFETTGGIADAPEI